MSSLLQLYRHLALASKGIRAQEMPQQAISLPKQEQLPVSIMPRTEQIREMLLQLRRKSYSIKVSKREFARLRRIRKQINILLAKFPVRVKHKS